MKSPRRTITIAIALAVASSLSIVVLRSFAESSTRTPSRDSLFDLKIKGWQKLKARPALQSQYDENGTAYENEILKQKCTDYCLTHAKKSDGHQTPLCPRSHPGPLPKADGRPAVNVTQKVSCATAADLQAILDTFDK